MSWDNVPLNSNSVGHFEILCIKAQNAALAEYGSGVACCCQSQHQCHFWQMNLMFEVYCTGK